MSNTNEKLKTSFMERYKKLKWAESFILDGIKMFEHMNPEEDCAKVINDFLSTASKYNLSEEDLNEVKQILNRFNSNEWSKTEVLAYLNYIYDVTTFKARQMWVIQDIFQCYW